MKKRFSEAVSKTSKQSKVKGGRALTQCHAAVDVEMGDRPYTVTEQDLDLIWQASIDLERFCARLDVSASTAGELMDLHRRISGGDRSATSWTSYFLPKEA